LEYKALSTIECEIATVYSSSKAFVYNLSRHLTPSLHFHVSLPFHFPCSNHFTLRFVPPVSVPFESRYSRDIPRLLSLILHMATIFNARYESFPLGHRILRFSCGMFELRQHYSYRYFRGSSVSSSASDSPLLQCACVLLCLQWNKTHQRK